LNSFFKDKQNPREQLQKLFEIVKPVLSPWVRNELYTILYQTDDEMFYIQELLRWKQKQKKKKNQESDESLKK
jgi:transcriptional regulatory protein LevR